MFHLGFFHWHKHEHHCDSSDAFPHNNWKSTLDKTVLIVGMIVPIISFHQAWLIWSQKSGADISMPLWITHLIVAAFWLAYGIEHDDKPIIAAHALWIVVDMLIIIGALTY
ncbi:MAG: SemiSWEET family transporter [Patescibacteria group bacterium]|nr:SemiSWEET family transporter [Patescibacteria group bacterium]